MARLVISTLISLDGHCAGPGGQLAGMPMDAAFDAHNLERLRHAGTLLFGRTTFCMFRSFWPNVAQDDAAMSPTVREIARRVQDAGKLVVSDTLAQAEPWGEAEHVRRRDAHARIRQLKAREDRDLLIYGSPVLASDLLAHGLVDELHLLVGNVLLGAGVPAFQAAAARPFKLLGQQRLHGSDTVHLHYAC
ncbi:dihydrofolate reductase family protein [Aquincola sp. S2]|uniref:Dihydrofolate reductase family protein n=1 Tax=Pseudaquabacterium terrae TaxID=2732868 RepID=A0ABX2ECV5_9BURK|nr:dihydrofolate reductase family protein [Aquabacterium terrae]NRF65788.1 dihydrofolate reductase family protein [Aquabacterium terrae]